MLRTSKINLNSTQQLTKELNRLGIHVENTKSEELAKFDHPIIKMLTVYKETEKLLNTFVRVCLKIQFDYTIGIGLMYLN